MATSLRWLLAVGSLALALAILWMWRPSEPRAGELPIAAEPRASEHSNAEPLQLALDLAEHASPAPELESRSAAVTVAPSERSDDVEVLVLGTDGRVFRAARVHAEGCEVGSAPAKMPAWSIARDTDADGRAHFTRAELSRSPCVVLRATAEPLGATEERVILDPRSIPRQILLQLERPYRLRVAVADKEGVGLRGATIVLASTNGHAPLVREEALSGSTGLWTFLVPRGQYEIFVRAGWIPADGRLQHAVVNDGQATIVLATREADELPVAVAGVVVDEEGRGIANVSLRSTMFEHATGRPDKPLPGRSAVTSEGGAFEIRGRACDEVQVHVADDPLLATYERDPVRVAFGTTSLVLRRARTWAPNKIRIHAIDAVSKAEVAAPALTMRLVGDAGGQRIFQGRDGWIDAQVPWRDDLAWKVDAVGYFAAEGLVSGLASRLRDGALELELVRDPREVPKAESPATIAADGAGLLPAHPR